MDLKSGATFWSLKNGLIRNLPRINADAHVDVLVVGAGITGALAAFELAINGHRVMVVDQGPVAWGSSSASTALLQYEIDTHLIDLAGKFGEADAVLAYRSCVQAIKDIEKVAMQFTDVEFANQKSLYVARSKRHAKSLRKEYELRRKHGLPVDWLDEESLNAQVKVDGCGAILSHAGAIVDPYRLAHRLLERVESMGYAVLSHSPVHRMQQTAEGIIAVVGETYKVHAKNVVIACGYESQKHLRQSVARNRSSYVMISQPLLAPLDGTILPTRLPDARTHFLGDTLYWETKRPYLYIRRTFDGRIMVGGEDDRIDIPLKRDASLRRKAKKLHEAFTTRFPDLPFDVEFTWAGTFAETEDGLPYIGRHRETGDRVYFMMAYGGNGIVYSSLGANLVRALIEGRGHPLEKLFGFDR